MAGMASENALSAQRVHYRDGKWSCPGCAEATTESIQHEILGPCRQGRTVIGEPIASGKLS
jgi:hypothetical protein